MTIATQSSTPQTQATTQTRTGARMGTGSSRMAWHPEVGLAEAANGSQLLAPEAHVPQSAGRHGVALLAPAALGVSRRVVAAEAPDGLGHELGDTGRIHALVGRLGAGAALLLLQRCNRFLARARARLRFIKGFS